MGGSTHQAYIPCPELIIGWYRAFKWSTAHWSSIDPYLVAGSEPFRFVARHVAKLLVYKSQVTSVQVTSYKCTSYKLQVYKSQVTMLQSYKLQSYKVAK